MKLGSVKLFVLDEADKMMDDAFLNEVTAVFNAMPEHKQCIALSASGNQAFPSARTVQTEPTQVPSPLNKGFW